MAPKKYPKLKEKVKMVHQEDLIPLSTLNKHKIEAKTVKLLKDSHLWNDLLTSNNRESVLARIQGLTDAMSDQICEAVNKIMVSLKSDADVFTVKIVDSLEKECHKEIHDSVRCCLLEAQVCAKNCYSFDEIHDIFHEKFGFDKEDTTYMYDRFFAPKKGHIAYKQLSSIRAAQRKTEQKQIGEEQAEKNEEHAKNNEEKALEKNEEQASEQEEEKHKQPTIYEEDYIPTETSEQREKQTPDSLLSAWSQQVNTLMDALKSQEKMLDEIISYQSEIAMKEDLDSFQIGIEKSLDSLGKDLAIKLADGIEDIFSFSSKTLEQTLRSELRGALSVLETTIKEKIEIESDVAVYKVTSSIPAESIHIVGEAEEHVA